MFIVKYANPKKGFLIGVLVLLLLADLQASPQNLEIKASKRGPVIPESCQSLSDQKLSVNTSNVEVAKAAVCAGAGDFMPDFTYVLELSSVSDLNHSRKTKSNTYEVYFPVLKSGTSARGILLETKHNGKPIAERELSVERDRAGKELEKAESAINPNGETSNSGSGKSSGMRPLGEYPYLVIGSLSQSSGRIVFDVEQFLLHCDLRLIGPSKLDGRDMILLAFEPRESVHFSEELKYLAGMDGRIWIDSADKIVARIDGWASSPRTRDLTTSIERLNELVPVVRFEMLRLPEGAWMPRTVQVNALENPSLFASYSANLTFRYSNYRRFTTDAKDVKIDSPKSSP